MLTIGLTLNSCKKDKKAAADEDPVSVIKAISEEVTAKGNDWSEDEWNEARDRLHEARYDLPYTLETAEKAEIKAYVAAMSAVAKLHERKAQHFSYELEYLSDKIKDEDSSDSDEDSGLDGTYTLKGSVSSYPITMNIEIDGESVKGSYYYDKKGPNAKLNLQGTNNDGELDINETDANGTPTGHFVGTMSNGTFSGQFITNQGKKMPFAVSESGSVELPNSGLSSSSDDLQLEGENWDEFLDEYEKYVNKVISYSKKIANGDLSAMVDYTQLIDESEAISEKLENAKGLMSPSQEARYTKLLKKMYESAQEAQKNVNN